MKQTKLNGHTCWHWVMNKPENEEIPTILLTAMESDRDGIVARLRRLADEIEEPSKRKTLDLFRVCNALCHAQYMIDRIEDAGWTSDFSTDDLFLNQFLDILGVPQNKCDTCEVSEKYHDNCDKVPRDKCFYRDWIYDKWWEYCKKLTPQKPLKFDSFIAEIKETKYND